MIPWLRKWNHCDQEDISMLCEYQETLMGDVLNFQVTIRRGVRDEERQDQVETIYEGIIMANHIHKQSASLGIQAEEGMEKIKYRDLV